MKLKKLMNGIDRTARIALAVCLAALTTVSVWAGYTYYNAARASTQRPTLLFRCMDFKLVDDGTIQALVRLSAENMPTFTGAAFNIDFNPYYIQPSFLEIDSGSGKEKQVLIDNENSSSNKHFEEDPALKTAKFPTATSGNPVSPFADKVDSGDNFKRNEVVPGSVTGETIKNGSLSMYLKLDNSSGNPQNYKSEQYSGGKQDVVQVMDLYGFHPWDKFDYSQGALLYIDATGEVDSTGKDTYEYDTAKKYGLGKPGNGVNLGSISFQVDPDHLTEMVTKFSEFISGTGTGTNFLIGYTDGVENKDSWMISDIGIDPESNPDYPQYRVNVRKPEGQIGKPNQGPWGDQAVPDKDDVSKWGQVVFEFIFPKVLVKADVAGGSELTVNAYQAYGVGTIDDIAATIQRYRPEITATYADASQENFIMNWGDTSAEGDYTVYRPYVEGTDISFDYTDRQNGKKWVKINNTDYINGKMYKGDREYMVTQNFWYTDQDDTTLKAFPLPMEVHLTVTPVNLVDVNASKLTATYTQLEAQKFNVNSLADLDLPDQAILSLSPIPGPITLTMPITTWVPNTIAGLATDDATPVQWPTAPTTNPPAVGTYPLQGPTAAAIIAYTEANYPWVTTDGFDKAVKATRTVIANDDAKDIKYTAQYLKTGTNGRLWLDVIKTKQDGETPLNYVSNTKFRTYLPNGTMINTETAPVEFPNEQFGLTMGQDGKADSTVDVQPIGNEAYLTYYPGAPKENLPNWTGRSSHQEDVARAINLGGWFYVSVSEETDVWSELIPVYVPPRTNYYAESDASYYNDNNGSTVSKYYNFDFSGLYAGLYPFYSNSTLPTNVVLPVGYTVTTTYDGLTGIEPGQLGEFQVEQWAGAQLDPTASPAAVDPAHTEQPWDSEAIIEYGDPGNPPATISADPLSPTDFKDTVYGAFGAVENHEPNMGTDTDYVAHTWDHTVIGLEQVHMRVQAPEYTAKPSGSPEPTPTPEPVDQPKESIRLIHEDGKYPNDHLAGITRNGNSEVTKVTYTLQSEGYIARQTYTLTIENNGDTDIYGLSVDVLNGAHKPENDGYDNHFEILIPPSAYIPAGGKTTFVVTYVYNLIDTDPSTKGTTYEDVLLITSNGHGADDPLKTFIANFEVTGDATYKVTVITDPDPSVPGNIDMGSAKIIEGPQTQPTVPSTAQDGDKFTGTEKPDRTTATDIYVAGTKYVWIGAEPKDEYKVREVYYIDGYNGNEPIKKPLYIHEYTNPDNGEEDTTYFFEMPAKNVTVVVEFYEPILAKLRLSRLMGYAGTSTDAVIGSGLSETSPGLLEKDGGTGKWEHPMRHNIRWYDKTTNIIQSDPAYIDPAPPTGDGIMNMTPDDSSRPKRPDYLLVLSDYANATNAGKAANELTRVQLDTRLRGNSLAPDIDDVTVEFHDYDLATNSPGALINSSDSTTGKTWIGTPPTTGVPTSHHTEVFEVPLSQNGEVVKKAVEIKLSCEITQAMIDFDPAYTDGDLGRTIERTFVVVIIRGAEDADVELNYGNSPKGMIYNDATLATSETKENAWTAFEKNNNSFVGIHTPSAAAKLTNTYWLEAWGDAWENTNTYNGDKDEYALFVLLGEPFQDPGFAKLKNTVGFDVDPKDVVRTAKVELLDTASTVTTQADRFNGQRTTNPPALDTVELQLGTGDKGLVTSTVTNDVINNWWQIVDEDDTVTADYAVRPGVYTVTYTFPNYDGTSLTAQRKFIVLAKVGDVNADRAVNNSGTASDVTYIKNRIKDPLGCMMTPNANAANAKPDYPDWRLFRYRSCDTNNDRNINNIDANQILHGKDRIVPYYKPTDYLSE